MKNQKKQAQKQLEKATLEELERIATECTGCVYRVTVLSQQLQAEGDKLNSFVKHLKDYQNRVVVGMCKESVQ